LPSLGIKMRSDSGGGWPLSGQIKDQRVDCLGFKIDVHLHRLQLSAAAGTIPTGRHIDHAAGFDRSCSAGHTVNLSNSASSPART